MSNGGEFRAADGAERPGVHVHQSWVSIGTSRNGRGSASSLHAPLVRHKITRRLDKKKRRKTQIDRVRRVTATWSLRATSHRKRRRAGRRRIWLPAAVLAVLGLATTLICWQAYPGSGAGPHLGGAEQLALSEHAPRGQICR